MPSKFLEASKIAELRRWQKALNEAKRVKPLRELGSYIWENPYRKLVEFGNTSASGNSKMTNLSASKNLVRYYGLQNKKKSRDWERRT